MQLTAEELAAQTLKPESLQLAVQSIRVNGYVIFESVLPRGLVETLHGTFLRVLNSYMARTDPNRGANRYQMHLPFMPPFIDPAVISHPFALAVIDELLGKECICHYFASDTPLPGSDYQRVHADIQLLFPETLLSLPAYSLVLNIPLVDFTEENGPLEIWPGGTHLMPGGINIQELAPTMNSERVRMPAGSLLLRDMRMWHRGTPNRSTAPRPNLALIYSRPWLKLNYPPIGIPRATHEALSERAQRLFRAENIGGELVNDPSME
jgi:Phytanoyl-CoA dioxygenase (PhyH)